VATAAGLTALVIVAGVGGYLFASAGSEPVPSVAAAPSSSPVEEPTPADSPSPSATTLGSTPPPVLEDGRHFVFVRSANASPASLRFDLAEFLTGAEAKEAAAERGDEVTSDYYIVNDNPRLRKLPVADAVRVRYIPVGACCELVDGTWDQYVEAVNRTAQTDLDPNAPWWITVRTGEVVRIEQQYLP
jgi:hypothetical protein